MKINKTIKIFSSLLFINLISSICLYAQPSTNFYEDFDGVILPLLPTGWQSVSIQGATSATTTNTASDTSPNSVILPNPNTLSDLTLVSPVISFNGGTGNYDLNVQFKHRRGMENNFDIGVLEISINGAAFKDFKDPSFNVTNISGDYNHNLSNNQNPLNGRSGWTGLSASFESVSFIVNDINDNANIRFRFRIATDTIIGSSGWLIDSFSATPIIDTSCEITPLNSDVLSGQATSFVLNIKNPSSVSLNSAFNIITVHSGYKIENLSLMPGTFSTPITLIALPGGDSFQLIDGSFIAPNSAKKYKIDLKTSNPPQASALFTFNPAANAAYSGAKLAANFLSSSKDLPEGGLNNVPVFPTAGLDFCNPIPAPLPAGLSGSLVINFIPTVCSAGQAALNAQNAGAVAYLGLPSSLIITDPFNPPSAYVIEPAISGLNIPVFTSTQFYLNNFNAGVLPFTPGTRVSILGSNNPQKSTFAVTNFNTSGDSARQGNNLCAVLVNLVTDQDADGTFDYLDACPSDPAKSSAGVCGCGAVDIDANSNGIIDCLTAQEAEDARIKEENRKNQFTADFKTKISSLLANLNKIKQKKFNKQKTERNAGKLSIDEIVQLSQNREDIILKSAAVDLSTLVKNLSTSGKKFFSKVKNFSKNKQAAVKDINALLAAF